MDPITLAVATSAVVSLGSKVLEGTSREAGKTLWNKIQSMLGFQNTPPPENLAQQVAERLSGDTQLTSQVLKEIQSHSDTVVGQLVKNVDADKVIIINKQHIDGDFNLNM